MAGPWEDYQAPEAVGPWKEYQPPSDAVIGKQAGELGRKAKASASAEARRILGMRDPDVDYTGIQDAGAQAKYSLISKPEDRTTFLQQRYGAENITKDSFGRDVVKRGDKKISFVPEEGENIGSQWAGLAGQAAPVTGMIAGGVVGAPLGPLGGMTFAAGGGGAGEAFNQLLARSLGLPQTQSSEEAAKQVVTQGMVPGALGEGAGRLLGYAGRSILAPYQPGSIFGPWSANVPRFGEQMAEVEAARSYGLRPHIGTASPNARLVMRAQAMGNRVFGDELPQMNRPILEREASALTESGAGGTVPERLRSPEELSRTVSSRATAIAEATEQQAAIARQNAEQLIKQSQEKISKAVGEPRGDLSARVEADIRAERTQFGENASALYKPVDDFASGPVVPTAQIKQTLKSILDEMPPTKSGDVSVLVPENLKTFAKGINDLPDMVTFQQMQAIRHKFYSKAEVSALNAGLSDRQAAQLAKAADRSFDDAAATFKATSGAVSGPGKEISAAVVALRKADAFYKDGIAKFDDLAVQALVKDARNTGFIEPEKVARFIARPGEVDKLLRVKSLVKPETFAEVGKETWSQTLRDSVSPITGEVDGKVLARKLNDLSKNHTLDVLFGENAPRMRQLANQFAALDGKAPVDVLSQGDIRSSIEKALHAQAASDAAMKTGWIKSVRADGPESLQAAEWLTRPGNRLELRTAITQLGPDSPTASALREYLARRIFVTMEQPATRGAEKYAATELMGEPLLKELNRYGKPYLEDVFGKQWTDSAYKFANAAEVATRKNPTDSGGIIASMLGIHPLHYVGTLARLFVGGELLSSNPVITYMSRGLARGETAQFLKDMAMLGTRTITAQQAVSGARDIREAELRIEEKAKNEAGR
jgi:hypothetical protein